MKKVRVDKFTPRDISDTPEGFEKRFADRNRPRKSTTPLDEPSRPNMTKLLEKFGIPDGDS